MELRFNVEDQLVNDLQERTRIESRAEICRQSMAMMSWAAAEVQAGRQIVSIDPSGGSQCIWPLNDVLNSARW